MSKDIATITRRNTIRRNASSVTKEPELRHGPRTQRAKEAEGRLRGRIGIAKAIIDARLQRQWTQQDLATAAGTKQSRISDLEGVRGNPTLETIERVSAVLGLEFILRRSRSGLGLMPAGSPALVKKRK